MIYMIALPMNHTIYTENLLWGKTILSFPLCTIMYLFLQQ